MRWDSFCLGWIAGSVAATLACLAAIGLETRHNNNRTTLRSN